MGISRARRDRRSSNGLRATLLGFRISHSSQTQAGLPALSSGESELRSLTRAASESLFLKNILTEMRLDVDIIIEGDATAALKNSMKLGPGKIRHLESTQFFVEEAIRRRLLRVRHISRTVNIADIFTHHLSPKDFAAAVTATHLFCVKNEPFSFRLVDMQRKNELAGLKILKWRTEEQKDDMPGRRSGVLEVGDREIEAEEEVVASAIAACSATEASEFADSLQRSGGKERGAVAFAK